MTPSMTSDTSRRASPRSLDGAGVVRSLVAGLLYGGGAFSIGFGLGVVRELMLAPYITSDLAIVVETPIMMWIVFHLARAFARWLKVPTTGAARLLMGTAGLALVVAAENQLSWVWQARSIFEQWALYGFLAAAATFVGLAWFWMAPTFFSRR